MRTLKQIKQTFLSFPLRILSRPFKGFDEMKNEGRGSMAFAVTMLLASAFLNILEFVYTGFIFSRNDPHTVNSLYLALLTLFPTGLFVLANWSVTTLMDGKGRMRDIFMAMMYAMFPFLIARVVSLLLSNMLTEEEGMVLTTIRSLGGFLFFMYLFIGLVVVHEYSFSGGIGSLLLTVAAIMVVLFILMLLLTLAGDVFTFLSTVVKELTLKYF